MRKSIKESDYILQFDEFLSLMKKEDVIVKVAKNGYVFFADDETLGNNLLGFINPNTSNQKLHIKVPVSTVASLDEFENTKELVDFIIGEYSHYKRKFESKKSARKSIKESLNIKDYCVEVYGDWFKEFYSDFDEFKNDLLYLSEGENEDVLPFTYDISPYSESSYVINAENDYGDKKQIVFVLIPKPNKSIAKELNNLLH